MLCNRRSMPAARVQLSIAISRSGESGDAGQAGRRGPRRKGLAAAIGTLAPHCPGPWVTMVPVRRSGGATATVWWRYCHSLVALLPQSTKCLCKNTWCESKIAVPFWKCGKEKARLVRC